MADHLTDDRPAMESDLFCPSCVFTSICVKYETDDVQKSNGTVEKLRRGTHDNRNVRIKIGNSVFLETKIKLFSVFLKRFVDKG